MKRYGRAAVAGAVTVLFVVQLALLVRYTVWPEVGPGPMGYFVTGLLTLVLGLWAWAAWRWVARSRTPWRSTAPLPEDDAPRPHRGLSGEDEPPRRW